MSEIKKRINSLSKLGTILGHLSSSQDWPGYECGINEDEYANALEAITSAVHHNGWFTPESVRTALGAWSKDLTVDSLTSWISNYKLSGSSPKKVAIIAAGNIPVVGLHDLISVIITGNEALIKLSSKDTVLMLMVINLIKLLDEELGSKIHVSQGKLQGHEAIIATGSNNSARYFEYYFKGKPSVIRKNRTSVALLNGSESEQDLQKLAEDIFTYYGLGCRNVTKVYVPRDYDLNNIFKALFHFKDIANHNKYANNYDYHRAIWLMNNIDLLENGFILLKEDESLVSPVGTLYYEYYDSQEQVMAKLDQKKDEIQCIVSSTHIPFGQAQKPGLSDYADGVDTIEFLLGLA